MGGENRINQNRCISGDERNSLKKKRINNSMPINSNSKKGKLYNIGSHFKTEYRNDNSQGICTRTVESDHARAWTHLTTNNPGCVTPCDCSR